MRPNLGSAPIFAQVLALVMLSVVAAEAINLAVVLWLPDPPPRGVPVADAARALRGESVIAPDGKRLRVSVLSGPPEFARSPSRDPLNGLLQPVLARALQTPVDQVRVSVERGDVRVRHAIHSVNVRTSSHGASVDRQERMFVTVTPEALPSSDLPPPLLDHIGAQMAGHMDPGTGQHLFPGMGGGAADIVFPPFAAAWRRPDGRWAVLAPERPLLSPWQKQLLIAFMGATALLLPLAWWVSRRLVRPIHLFASAAERLGRDPHAPPLTGSGPSEVRTAMAAFNEMQERLRRYVDERTAMIAAIAHDLRTPLMRLRFRIESAPDETRLRAAADIEQMDAMISAALAFARGERGLEQRARLDFTALAASVVDDMADTGADVRFDARKTVVVEGDALSLKRLVTNLISNAVKFGDRASVELRVAGGQAILTVDDAGPGLPEPELTRVFEPFYRADPARGGQTGGFGLGLAAARSVALAHAGSIELANLAGGGLRATLRLPVI